MQNFKLPKKSRNIQKFLLQKILEFLETKTGPSISLPQGDNPIFLRHYKLFVSVSICTSTAESVLTKTLYHHKQFAILGLFFLLALLIGFFVPFLHRYGSKKLLISGLLVIAFSLILLTISTFLTSSSMIYLSVPALLFYFIGAGCGPLLAILSLPSEITTSRSRPMVFWFSGIVFWMVGTIVVFAAPFALSSMGGYTYIIFIILVLLDVSITAMFIFFDLILL